MKKKLMKFCEKKYMDYKNWWNLVKKKEGKISNICDETVNTCVPDRKKWLDKILVYRYLNPDYRQLNIIK